MKGSIRIVTPVAVVFAFSVGLAHAGAFWPGTVRDVPDGDTLTIRDAPLAEAREIGRVEFGTAFSLSGLCRNNKTGYSFMIEDEMNKRLEMPRDEALKEVAKRMSAPNVWCHIASVGNQPGSIMMIDGWARGSFIWPD